MKTYISPLFQQIPRTKIPISSADFDKQLCWHCQEEPRIIGTPDVIIWCMRCYKLHFLKGDGTFTRQSTMPIGKDLIDIQQGKVKVIPEVIVERKVIQE